MRGQPVMHALTACDYYNHHREKVPLAEVPDRYRAMDDRSASKVRIIF